MIVLKNKQGWITVACAFVLQGLTHGLASSMGVFYIQWENTFPASSTLISALATSVLATILCTAPIAGAISRKAGIRLAIATGGALAFSGFICTSFVQNAAYLFITVAFMIGFGSSVVYMASVIAVSNHFTKNFATAAGVANAGASVGVLILPILFEVLVSTYDWRGACLIVASIQLHIFVCMMIIKVPQGFGRYILRKPPPLTPVQPSEQSSTVPPPASPIPQTSPKTLRQSNPGRTVSRPLETRSQEAKAVDEKIEKGEKKVDSKKEKIDKQSIPTKDDKPVDVPIESTHEGKVGSTYSSVDSETGEDRDTGIHLPPLKEQTVDSSSQDNLQCDPADIGIRMANSSACLIKDSPGVVKKGQVADRQEEMLTDLIDISEERHSQVTGSKAQHDENRKQTCCDWLASYLNSFLDLFNIKLLWRNLPFTNMILTFFLGGCFWGTILPHLAARAVKVEIDVLLASSLISIIGAGNIISRVFYGRLVDSGLVHPVHLYFFSHVLTSLSSLVIAFGSTYGILCLGAFGVGIGSGIYIPLMQPIVRSLVGVKDFAGGLGLSLLSVGIANYMSATAAGLIYDITKNYTYVFLLPTGLGTLSAWIILLSHFYWGVYRKHPNWPKRAERNRQTSNEDTQDNSSRQPEAHGSDV